MNELRIGVIGCGYWGPNLIRNFIKTPHAKLVAVADLNASKLASVHRLYPMLERYASGEALLRKAKVDAVAIATPVSTHFKLGQAALKSGRHVLVDKPMAATSSEAKELVRLARRLRRTLMVDHTFVFSGAVRKIRELIRSGELGDIYYYDSVRVNLGLFQHDTDVLWDLGPHDFSIMTYLLRKKAEGVLAVGSGPVRRGGWRPKSVVYITIRFSDKTLAHFHLNWLSPVKVRRTLIGGSRKMVVYDHLDPDNQVKVFNKGVEVKTDKDRSQVLIQYRMGDMLAPKVDQTEALEIACAHFVDCIRRRRRPITDGASGLEVVKLLEAAQASLKRNGAFVRL